MNTFHLNRPNVVATVTQEQDLVILAEDAGLALPDVLEFRLDNLADHLDLTKKTIEKLPEGVAKLVTARHPGEGGVGDLDGKRRVELYRQFLSSCDLIDTEIRSLETPEFKEFIAEMKGGGQKVIGSFHDFEKCPSRDFLSETIARAYDSGAEIAKVAVVVATFRELNILVELVEEQREQGRAISAMGMGPLGKLSRLVLARAGSCLNYGYLRVENAPGQWSATELSELIKVI